MKTKTIPFDIEIAKKIQAGEIEGKIVTNEGNLVEIVRFNLIQNSFPILAIIRIPNVVSDYWEDAKLFQLNGKHGNGKLWLEIELPEEVQEEQHPIEESELYQAGYKVGFEAGRRCVAFDEEKGCAIKGETPKHDFIVGELVKIISGRYSGRRGTIEEIIEEPLTSINRAKVSIDENTHPYFPFEYLERCSVGSKEETSKHEFKPFDKVLVRNASSEWKPKLYSQTCILDDGTYNDGYMTIDEKRYRYCIPYEGNEHLVGTTDKPKEE